MKKIIVVAGIGMLTLGACGSGGSTSAAPPAKASPVADAITATPKPTPKVTKPPSPAPAKTIYVTPQPDKTVYVVPAPAPATTVYVAPAPNYGAGGMDGPNTYPINSNGAVINVRVGPTTGSAIVGTVVQNQYVHVACTTYGEAVSGPWGTTTLWDRIDSPYYGYVSDMWVNTATGAPVVGSC